MIYCNALDFNECRSKEVSVDAQCIFFYVGRLRIVIDSYTYY